MMLGCLMGAAAFGAAGQEPETDFRWVLVRLPEALDGMLEDGSFPLRTGLESVDTAVRDLGIWRIEYALPASARNPAMARPRPELAPVTTATRPARSNSAVADEDATDSLVVRRRVAGTGTQALSSNASSE